MLTLQETTAMVVSIFGPPAATLLIPLDPVPCPRPRVALRGGFASAYYPVKYTKYRDAAAELLDPGDSPLSGPILTVVEFAVAQGKSKPSNPYPNADLDNYLKSPFDVITKLGGYWVDDKQVVMSMEFKRWAERNEPPYTRVSLWSMDWDTR